MGLKVVYLIGVFFCLYRGSSTQCDISIRKELPGKDPVLLSTTGELLHPSGPSMIWEPYEESVLVCSGDRNSFALGSNSELTIKCYSKDTFKVGKDNLKFNELECRTGVTGDVEKTKKKCAGSGTLYEIGFKTKRFGLVKYIDVCYNTKIASVIYTYHVLRGASVKDSVSDNDRPGFKVSGIPPHVKPADSYKQTKQLKRFTNLLGDEGLAKTYLNKTSFLARGHLAPDNDGVFKSWQAATYFYLNVAPQWQIVNSGNWLRVENLVRKVASQLGDDVEVYTGNHGVLTLPDVNNNPVELSLEPENNIAVPKFFWKILKHKSAGIAFITLNNPFATEKENLCKDVCKKYGFNNPTFEDFTRGYTYCCTVTDFAKAVKYLPKEAEVKTVLNALLINK